MIQPIGVFDSGVGGLSILIELKKILPNESFIFLADQAFMPYGKKNKKELVGRVSKIIDFFVKKNVKAVVIACNTATVYTIDEMRKKFAIPLIGTVPAIKTAAELSKTKKIAVFSTPATTKSPYLKNLISEFASTCKIYRVGGSNLEELLEGGDIDAPEVQVVLKQKLLPLIAKQIDAVVLGCTHYPFLRKNIEDIIGPNIAAVDSGKAIAKRTFVVLNEHNSLLKKKTSEDIFMTTGNASDFHVAAQKLMKIVLPKAEHVDL